MVTELFIARRYLFSKKSTSTINIISAVSATGIMVATMSLVVVLSAFNGFSDLVATLFTSFDQQLKVIPTEGKRMPHDIKILQDIRGLDDIDVATETLEDQALAIYGRQQAMVKVKGVDDTFQKLVNINGILFGDGRFDLHAPGLEYGIPGIRLAYDLGMSAHYDGYLHVYAPNRMGQYDMTTAMDGFVADSLMSPGVVFSVQQARYDKDYIITSLQFAQMLFQCDGEISALELRLRSGADTDRVKKQIQTLITQDNAKVKVLDRYEQQQDTFSIMKIEKLMAYAILCFILLIACFNIIGSLTMLIIDKRNDMDTLRSLGATDSMIHRIFLLEGWMTSTIGAVAGVALGLLLCWLQQQYGLVRLGGSSGSFIIDAYPISVHYTDVALILLTVITIGFIAAALPKVKH